MAMGGIYVVIGVYRVSACTIPVLSKTSCTCGERGPGVLVLGLCVRTGLSEFSCPCAELCLCAHLGGSAFWLGTTVFFLI